MREDQLFEIERALDLLPHIAGGSWAMIWFRMKGIKNPTKEEFREKVVEYFKMLEPLVNVYPQDKNFEEIITYLKKRNSIELDKISSGRNPEVEKRYERYVDYG